MARVKDAKCPYLPIMAFVCAAPLSKGRGKHEEA